MEGRISTLPRKQSLAIDRGSVANPKQKRMNRFQFDEDAMKIFFDTHGVTEKDIDIAFDMISKDKKKIYHSDIKAFIATYFDNLPDEAMSLLNQWKEEVTKEQLNTLLINRNLMSSPYENAMKVSFSNLVVLT
jgi:GTPase Era involved in 16S rRNA processing